MFTAHTKYNLGRHALPLDCSSSGGEVGAVFTKRGKPEIPVGESTKVGSQVGWYPRDTS